MAVQIYLYDILIGTKFTTELIGKIIENSVQDTWRSIYEKKSLRDLNLDISTDFDSYTHTHIYIYVCMHAYVRVSGLQPKLKEGKKNIIEFTLGF